MKKAGIAALGLIAVLAVGATSASAGDSLIIVKAAKHKDGPYKPDIQSLNLPLGESKTLYWRVKNIDNNETLKLAFDDAVTEADDEYRVRWFKGKTNISSEVKGAGYEFKLKPGAKKGFRATLKYKSPSSDEFCLGGQVTGSKTNADSAYFQVNGLCV